MQRKTTAQQTRLILQAFGSKHINPLQLLKILTLDLDSSHIGKHKSKKWICEHFGIFVEELEVYGDNLGKGIFSLERDKQKSADYSLNMVMRLLEMDCRQSGSFELFSEVIESLSSLERKWFISFWVREPKLKMDRKRIIINVLSKHFDLEPSYVEKDSKMHELETMYYAYSSNRKLTNKTKHGLFVPPMLGKSYSRLNGQPTNSICEYRYSGIRVQIHKKKDNIIFFNRKGKLLNLPMKTKQEILDCPSDFILDAELYCVDGDEKPIDYYEVLKILHKKTPEPSNLRYVILDCLSMGGNCLLDMPFSTRLKTMETLPCLPIRSEENEDATAFYNQSISDGFDGILIKDMDAKYQPNEKSDSLVIYSPPRIDLYLVVIGAKVDSKNAFSSFEIAYRGDNEYISIGYVSGLSSINHKLLSNMLRKLVSKADESKYSFMPRIVLHIKAELIMKKNDKYSLKLARIHAIRNDKYAIDSSTVQEIQAIVGDL
jgi:DNA ligase-1